MIAAASAGAAPGLAIVRCDDVPPTRWRNGGGWTRELVAWPSARDWVVRASVADVAASGPFSAFPGVERWIAVLDGEGIVVEHDAAPGLRLTPADALHRFRGEAATHARLLGEATRDFNMMVRRDAATATVAPLPAGHAATSDWSGCFAATPVHVRLAGESGWHALPPRALAWTAAPSRLVIEAPHDARGWRIDVVLAQAVAR